MKRLTQSRPIRKQTAFTALLVWAVLTLWLVLAQTAFAFQEKLNKESNTVVTQTTFIYQGQLKERGVPASGTYDLQFILYPAQTGGDELGSIVHEDVILTNGSFRVQLDFGRTAFDGSQDWLEVAVRPGESTEPYTVLLPRQRLTPTPYAILAQEEPWSLIGVPLGITGGAEVIKSSDPLKADETPTAGSTAALAPSGTPNFIAKFDAAGNPTANSIMFDDGTNVGIGTINPSQKLDVAGNINYAGQLTKLDVAENPAAAIRAADLYLGHSSRRGTPGRAIVDNGLGLWINFGRDWTHTVVASDLYVRGTKLQVSDDDTVRISLQPNSGANDRESLIDFWSTFDNFPEDRGIRRVGRIQSGFDGLAWGTEYMAFGVAGAGDAANPPIERMRISANGNVGIGTTNPETKLHVANGRSSFRANSEPYALSVGYNDVQHGSDAFFFGVTDNGGTSSAGNLQVSNAGGTPLITVENSGNVGIGTTSPEFKLDVAGHARATSFRASSDARLKTNVTPLTDVLEKLDQIRGVSFEWNEVSKSLGHLTGERDIGVIAQEVEAAFPELVTSSGEEGYKAVDYGRLTTVLIEAVKELKAENQALRARLCALEQLVKELKQALGK